MSLGVVLTIVFWAVSAYQLVKSWEHLQKARRLLDEIKALVGNVVQDAEPDGTTGKRPGG